MPLIHMDIPAGFQGRSGQHVERIVDGACTLSTVEGSFDPELIPVEGSSWRYVLFWDATDADMEIIHPVNTPPDFVYILFVSWKPHQVGRLNLPFENGIAVFVADTMAGGGNITTSEIDITYKTGAQQVTGRRR